jgi:hypothetical protein
LHIAGYLLRAQHGRQNETGATELTGAFAFCSLCMVQSIR